jgi:hypothetical protein
VEVEMDLGIAVLRAPWPTGVWVVEVFRCFGFAVLRPFAFGVTSAEVSAFIRILGL